MRTIVVRPTHASVEEAITRSSALLAAAHDERTVVISASVLEPGPTVVLGALQRAGRVLDLEEVGPAGVRVLRRPTTGTGFALDGGLLVSLALPSLDAVFSDVTPRTFLNRNVRPIMRGLDAAGLPCSYFGREWLSARGTSGARARALAVLGFELEPGGAALFEAYLTLRGSLEIPGEIASDLERSCERYRGRPTMSLEEAERPSPDVEHLLAAMAERIGFETRWVSGHVINTDARRTATTVTREHDPIDADAELFEPKPIPIGFMDRARVGRESWVGGDMLGPSFALGFAASWSDPALPMEGAVWGDVRRADDMTQHHLGMRPR